MRRDTVFVHSLWRSGSTYLFKVFRDASSPYWCYQEPIHEFVLDRQDSPYALLEVGDGNSALLRHPPLDKPYLWELFETFETWRGLLAKQSIYDEYFAKETDKDLQNYLSALISSAPARPMIQECRTSSRIGALRKYFGGIHIYLWRNPWDQWWSFKTTSYFDVVAMLALNAPTHPEAIGRLRSTLDFDAVHDDDINKEYHHFDTRPLSSRNSYKVFFMLWCLGWLEAKRSAHIDISIDMLASDLSYREKKQADLAAMDVTGLDFSGAKIHQSKYFSDDFDFFLPLEEEVFSILRASGVGKSELDALQVSRKAAEPSDRSKFMRPHTTSEEDLARLRAVLSREMSDGAQRVRHLFHHFGGRQAELANDASTARVRVNELEDALQASEQKREAAKLAAEEEKARATTEAVDHQSTKQIFIEELANLQVALETQIRDSAAALSLSQQDAAASRQRVAELEAMLQSADEQRQAAEQTRGQERDRATAQAAAHQSTIEALIEEISHFQGMLESQIRDNASTLALFQKLVDEREQDRAQDAARTTSQQHFLDAAREKNDRAIEQARRETREARLETEALSRAIERLEAKAVEMRALQQIELDRARMLHLAALREADMRDRRHLQLLVSSKAEHAAALGEEIAASHTRTEALERKLDALRQDNESLKEKLFSLTNFWSWLKWRRTSD